MEEENGLDTGDTVRLKIGGPLMTLLSVSGNACCCMWFGEGARLEHGEFELEAIELVEPATRLLASDTGKAQPRQRAGKPQRSNSPRA